MTQAIKKRSEFQLASLHSNYEYRLICLTEEVETTLVELISESDYLHPDYEQPAIKVNVFGYTALIFLNEKLTFIDVNGHPYSLYADCTLTDLLDIIKEQSKI